MSPNGCREYLAVVGPAITNRFSGPQLALRAPVRFYQTFIVLSYCRMLPDLVLHVKIARDLTRRSEPTEYRYAEGGPERLEGFAHDLVRLGVDVIVARATISLEVGTLGARDVPGFQCNRVVHLVDPSSGAVFWREIIAGPPLPRRIRATSGTRWRADDGTFPDIVSDREDGWCKYPEWQKVL